MPRPRSVQVGPVQATVLAADGTVRAATRFTFDGPERVAARVRWMVPDALLESQILMDLAELFRTAPDPTRPP